MSDDIYGLCIQRSAENETLPLSNFKSPELGSGPLELALFKSKFWRTGSKIRVKFMGGSQFVRSRVMNYAQEWEKYANIDFRFVGDDDPNAEIRVAFVQDGGSWSYIGTDHLNIAKDQATMNFGWFNDQTSEQEFSRTTVHEFGHALGCLHEHQSPNAKIDWNKEAVIAYFTDQGWNINMIEANIFNQVTADEAVASLFDLDSIMQYWFRPEWVNSRVGAPVNYVLSQTDKAMISTIYPFQVRDQGEWSTLSDRPWYPPQLLNSKQIDFSVSYVNPPRVVVGISGCDIWCGKNQRLRASVDSITPTNMVVHADSWADTALYSAKTTWVEVEDTDYEFQVGTFDTLTLHPWYEQPLKNNARVDFNTSFSEPPNVMVWLTGFDFGAGHNFRITVTADAIDANGFTIHLDTWADTLLCSATASWIAYPKNKAGVLSGEDDTYKYRSWYPSQLTNGRKVTFPKDFFDRTPKVFAGISLMDYDSARNLRINSSVDGVSADGFTWHGDSWADTLCYGVGVNWIAFG